MRRRYAQGNPALERTKIHNFDVRWELFPTPTEVFAISGFYKLFQDPIETVVLDQNGNLSFENINGAQNYGAELEARLSLGLISPALDEFNALANLALIQSNVDLVRGTAAPGHGEQAPARWAIPLRRQPRFRL